MGHIFCIHSWLVHCWSDRQLEGQITISFEEIIVPTCVIINVGTNISFKTNNKRQDAHIIVSRCTRCHVMDWLCINRIVPWVATTKMQWTISWVKHYVIIQICACIPRKNKNQYINLYLPARLKLLLKLACVKFAYCHPISITKNDKNWMSEYYLCHSTLRVYSKYIKSSIRLFWFLNTSQSTIFPSYRDGSSWVEPVQSSG